MKADKIIELIAEHGESPVVARILSRLVHDMNGSVAAISMDVQLLGRRRERLASRIGPLGPDAADMLEGMSSVLTNIKDAAEDLRAYLEALERSKPRVEPAEAS